MDEDLFTGFESVEIRSQSDRIYGIVGYDLSYAMIEINTDFSSSEPLTIQFYEMTVEP